MLTNITLMESAVIVMENDLVDQDLVANKYYN